MADHGKCNCGWPLDEHGNHRLETPAKKLQPGDVLIDGRVVTKARLWGRGNSAFMVVETNDGKEFNIHGKDTMVTLRSMVTD